MKRAMINLMRIAGAFAPVRMANRDKALILIYHRFSSGRSGEGETTSSLTFARQLQYLTAHYRIVSLSRLVEYLITGQKLPPRIAVITIDDGYRDAYEIAFPLLRRFKAPATFFVVTDFVDGKCWLWPDKLRFLARRSQVNRLDTAIGGRRIQLTLDGPASRLEAAATVNTALKMLPDDAKEDAILRIASTMGVELPVAPPQEYGPITWAQARAMDTAGVEIGAHTVTHPILTRVGDERLRSELYESRCRLEAMLNREADLFCYPNGDHDDRVRLAVLNAGFRGAVTVEGGLNAVGSDLLRLRRVHTDNNFARFLQSTSGFEQIKNRLRFGRANRLSGVRSYSYGRVRAED